MGKRSESSSSENRNRNRGKTDIPEKKLRGVALFAVIYDEISKAVGEEFSSVQLLQVANELIKISRDEYVDKVAREPAARPNYYSYSVDSAFFKRPWKVVEEELKTMGAFEDPDISSEALARYRLINLSIDDSELDF